MKDHYLAVSNLRVFFNGRGGLIRAVDGIDMHLHQGERFGLIGESGSGKSMVALSIMGLLPRTALRTGSVRLNNHELTALDAKAMRKIRGRELAMIFEQPAAYLDPLFTVGQQIEEAITSDPSLSAKARRSRVIELLHQVQMPEPNRTVKAYPFELSGGMQQRAMIAIAIASKPNLLLADEPTTALDPRVQGHILALLDETTQTSGMTLILITHDLAAIKRLCSRVAVMYAGRIIETGTEEEVLSHPKHPYTKAIMNSFRGPSLQPIVGTPPSLSVIPSGCTFHPRCPHAERLCSTKEPSLANGVRCHFLHAA